MAKFLNKKEQVYELKLTSYGRYLLSMGKFNPAYYGFYDDNVIYDGEYAGLTETQSDIRKRIKEDTEYLEGLILFNELENASYFTLEGATDSQDADITWAMQLPRASTFRYDKMIGDAYLDADSNNIAPAWKAVLLSGEIILLTKNFDIEMFEIQTDAISSSAGLTDSFVRKYFYKNESAVRGGFISDAMGSSNVFGAFAGRGAESLTASMGYYYDVLNSELEAKYYESTASIGYYLNILYDYQINNSYQIGRKTACKAAQLFNKKSYYIDLEFDCEDQNKDRIYVDIYGQATEPEICK